jgi:hypothetical protein
MSCVLTTQKGGKQFIDAVNLKQAHVWMSVSRAVTQTSTFEVLAFFPHIQDEGLNVSLQKSKGTYKKKYYYKTSLNVLFKCPC